ncbi:hypothetical protein BR93DRAFT_115237 [Coniochaeta sp. PMI_546]|nr:hypothetical protein BR93DRAFT_115237 [Coniochaeta sp. PMI_546]
MCMGHNLFSPTTTPTNAPTSIIALALVTIFLVEGLRPPKPPLIHHTPGGYVSTPVYGPPVGQPVTYQYQQQQQPYQYQQQHSQPVMTSAQPFPPQYTNPTALDNKYTPTTSTTPISPIASPVSAPTTSPSPIQAPISQPPYQPYDRTNRIDVIRRICTLQNPNGSWSYSPELADLVRQWSGGGGGGGREIRPGDDRALTLAVHACLKDLCGYVWAAQRDRAEETRLAPGEMASFRAVNWDLGFARGAIDRALRWARPF